MHTDFCKLFWVRAKLLSSGCPLSLWKISKISNLRLSFPSLSFVADCGCLRRFLVADTISPELSMAESLFDPTLHKLPLRALKQSLQTSAINHQIASFNNQWKLYAWRDVYNWPLPQILSIHYLHIILHLKYRLLPCQRTPAAMDFSTRNTSDRLLELADLVTRLPRFLLNLIDLINWLRGLPPYGG
ncbi:hypothetical protein RU639_003853 [Aspergillus parasiticus]